MALTSLLSAGETADTLTQFPPRLLPPTNVRAVDAPNDAGRQLDVYWDISPSEKRYPQLKYHIYRGTSPDGEFKRIAVLASGAKTLVQEERELSFRDSDNKALQNGREYYYKVAAVLGEAAAFSQPSGPAIPQQQWFHRGRTTVFVFSVVFSLVVILSISYARKGKEIYIRPIAGVGAVDEAIGRATEMGRPILFVPGLGEAYEVATIAAFTVLGRIAKMTAEYQSRIIVPCYYPMVMIVAQETVKAAYMDAGRPDLYREEDIFFLTQEQFPYAAAVNGIILRERPATNFYLGKFYAESLMLAETGFLAGSIQVAGTDEPIQIPFFVAACDYTLIGEELYAASAYLSKDPLQLGTLKGQDIFKFIVLLAVGVGFVASLLKMIAWNMSLDSIVTAHDLYAVGDWYIRLFNVTL